MNLPRGKPASDRDVPRVGSVLGLAYTHTGILLPGCVLFPFFSYQAQSSRTTRQNWNVVTGHDHTRATWHGHVSRACDLIPIARGKHCARYGLSGFCYALLCCSWCVCVCMYVTSQSKIGARSECVPTIGAILSSSSNPGCAHDQSAIISTKA